MITATPDDQIDIKDATFLTLIRIGNYLLQFILRFSFLFGF
ncbi:hypothetical protein [Oscillatoria sp. FACHB-1407]|nr:hypothetical protein [Oscillatoria sp. FACHB-1407]